MIGIASCGVYIPTYRMDRDVVADMWNRGSLGGERSVANNDEDSVTMAVEAARNCLRRVNSEEIDGLFFATTSPVYQEKMSAAIVAAAVDLKREISTADFAHTLRAGTGALKVAFDSVKSGSMKRLVITASDCRVAYPRSDQEQAFGDGAAALMVSKDDVLASFEGSYSICNEMIDVWRNSEDTFVRTWEARFILTEGYTKNMKKVITGILERFDLEPKDISKAAFPAPDIRTHRNLAEELGFDLKTQIQDPILSRLGYCGTAHSFLMLVGALEEAKPGDTLLLASYGDGADAMIFKVCKAMEKGKNHCTIKDFLDQKIMLNSYPQFLSYKGLVETIPGDPLRLFPSATVTWRDRNSLIRCLGSKCRQCGMVTYPIQRVCYGCNSRDDFEKLRISDLEGEVFTFTLDNLAGRSDDPVVVQTVAELGEDKVRFYGMMTDCDPSKVRLGMPVGLTFRRIYDAAGMHNYFWKVRPLQTRIND